MSIWRVYDAFGNILEEGSNAAANAHDGNTTTYYTLYLPELFGAPYIIEEDFGQPIQVSEFKVYPTAVDAFNWVRVEYWTGSGWALVGYATTNNAWNTFSGSWTTSKWRVLWDGDFEFGGFSVRVNEMQAVQAAQPLIVSDSGTGTERTVKFADGAVEVSDIGTGTEIAAKPSSVSIWTVYDIAGNIIERGPDAAAAVHDGDITTYYTLGYPYSIGIPYIIEEDFGQTITVTQFMVYPTLVHEFNAVRVEYWTGSAWALVGYTETDNAWNVFSGLWTTSKWRVVWVGDPSFGGGMVRVNEMQAVQAGWAQTLTVSDSGTGTESAVKFVGEAMEVVDSGTGTESATKTTFGSTWTVYDAFGNILEEGSNAAANAHDDDISTYYILYPPPPYGPYDHPYIIEEDFGQSLTVTQFKVYATNVNEYSQIRVEYWTGSAWSLVGYVTTADTWTTFSGSWTTRKWRVLWWGNVYEGSAVRVNEMQALSQPPPLTVSDSGTGSETASTLTVVVVSDTGTSADQITYRALLDLRDVGSGTETAPPPSNLITITDSGSGTETAVSIPHIFVTDSGWGNEAPTQLFIFHMTDTGGGVEELLMDMEVYDASSLSGEEIALVFGQFDEGSGTEDLPLRLVGVRVNGTGQETSTLIVIAKDNGVGGELAIVTNQLSASDEGFGLEKPLRVIHVGAFVFLRPD